MKYDRIDVDYHKKIKDGTWHKMRQVFDDPYDALEYVNFALKDSETITLEKITLRMKKKWSM